MTETSSLTSIIASCHIDLDRLFFAHQEAVLNGDLPGALDGLHRYSVAHDLHKRFEETHLFPKFAEVDDPGSWPLRIYQHEHDKIESRLQEIRATLTDLIERSVHGTELSMAIIALLDQEKSYKGLCEHHQEREEAGMLPALDNQTDAGWRRSLIEQFAHEWQATLNAQP